MEVSHHGIAAQQAKRFEDTGSLGGGRFHYLARPSRGFEGRRERDRQSQGGAQEHHLPGEGNRRRSISGFRWRSSSSAATTRLRRTTSGSSTCTRRATIRTPT